MTLPHDAKLLCSVVAIKVSKVSIVSSMGKNFKQCTNAFFYRKNLNYRKYITFLIYWKPIRRPYMNLKYC